MNNINEDKKILREEHQRRRDAFYGQLDGATRNLAFRRPPSPLEHILGSSAAVALYAPQGSEAPTNHFADFLSESQKTIAFPVVTGEGPLEFRIVSNIKLLQDGFMGIAEPTDDCPMIVPDVIFTPMIAFDRSLNRLGQGGGHYDRTFHRYPNAYRIGLAWSVQETEDIPIEPHDVPLHAIITESELIQKVNATS